MTNTASTQRSLAVLALVAGVTGALTAQNARAFGYLGVAIIVEQAQSGGVRPGGAGKYFRRTFLATGANPQGARQVGATTAQMPRSFLKGL